MERTEITSKTRHYISCPSCKEQESEISHLLQMDGQTHSFGPWYCESCGEAYRGHTINGEVWTEKVAGQRQDKSIVFLKHGNVLLAVEGVYFDGKIDSENQQYYYEEHTCPVNFLSSVIEVYDIKNMRKDAHGLFEYIGTIPFVDLDDFELSDIIVNNKKVFIKDALSLGE